MTAAQMLTVGPGLWAYIHYYANLPFYDSNRPKLPKNFKVKPLTKAPICGTILGEGKIWV